MNELGWLYLAGGTVLFFFWVYGIVSFVLDCKNRYVPAARRFIRERRREPAENEEEHERDERERQLY